MLVSSSTVLNERYELQELIARGGSSEVWRAWDREVGVERAVKVLSSVDPTARRRLQREARAMATIGHAHVLPVYDLGSSGEVQYIVMRLASESLHDRLTRLGRLPADEAVRATIDVLDALYAAHTAGVVHRDVKPHNVLIDEHGEVMLADFGVAKLERDSQHLTQTQAMLGSLAYMPPEQRLDPAAVDAAVDRYAAGAMLFQLVTGDSPMDLFAETPDSDRWSAVPKVLRPALQKACSADPAGRYLHARQMADALTHTLPSLESASRRSPWPPIIALVVALASLGALAASMLLPSPHTADAPSEPAAVPSHTPALATTPEPPQPDPAPSHLAEAPPSVELPTPPARRAAPSPAERPRRTEAGPTQTLLDGHWRGSLDGYPATLSLDGPSDAIVGQLSSRDASHTLSGRLTTQRVFLVGPTGSLDVQLRDARLVGTWSPDGSREVLPISLGLVP